MPSFLPPAQKNLSPAPVMTITRAKTTRGENLIAFTGRTAKKTLKPGRYTLTLVAANSSGRSTQVTLSFSVLSGR